MAHRIAGPLLSVLLTGAITLGALAARPGVGTADLSRPSHAAAQARSEWTVVTSTTGVDLWSVAAVSERDMWAVGDAGTVLHWNGVTWRATGAPAVAPGATVNAIAMRSATDGWAVGDDGAIYRWNGIRWSGAASPTGATLTALALVSPVDGWAVGWDGTILHWDGVRWSLHATGVDGGEGLTGVSMAGAADGWAVGWFGTILHWDGTSWTVVDSPAVDHLAAVSAVGAEEAWAVGRWGTILRWDGRAWAATASPTENELTAVSVSRGGEGWAVGQSGTILHWDGGSWAPVPAPVTADLASVAIAGGSDVCTVGRGGTILHRGTIAATPTPTRTSTSSRTPWPSSTPTPTITPGPSPTPTATPLVRGSVRLAPGRIASCAEIDLIGTFTATSGVAPVGEMRTDLLAYHGSCRDIDQRIVPVAWRPFADQETFRVHGGPHYYGAALGVQYRDALGNVSPVYCVEHSGVCYGTQTPVPCADPYEPDDTPLDAKPLTEPGDQLHSICPPGDVDFVGFDACAGCYYQFTASGMPGEVAIRLQLLAPDGATELPLSPDGGHSWHCTSSGSYFVKASDHDPRAGAPDHIYSLQINLLAQDTPPPPPPPPLPPPPAYMPLTVRNLSRDAFPPPPAPVPKPKGGHRQSDRRHAHCAGDGLYAVHGWAVGWNGAILHWDGIRWSLDGTAAAVGEALASVSMVASDDGWAVGRGSTILHWDGASWSKLQSPVSDDLTAVDAVSRDDAWAVGSQGVILHWDGETWSAVRSPTQEDLNAVDVEVGGGGWAVGQRGTILRWDASSWTAATSPTEADLSAVAVVSETDAVAVGSRGTILQRGTMAATATRTPLPTRTQTPSITPGPSPTPTATPLVRGSVELRLARRPTSCRGVELVGAFTATSAVALVSQMRTSLVQTNMLGCGGREPEVRTAAWRAFVVTEAYRVDAGPHYYMFALGVQYKDDLGNVSPVYCGSIVGECLGTPTLTPAPTLTPTVTPTPSPSPCYLPLVVDYWRR